MSIRATIGHRAAGSPCQLRNDHRTLALLLAVPVVLITLMRLRLRRTATPSTGSAARCWGSSR